MAQVGTNSKIFQHPYLYKIERVIMHDKYTKSPRVIFDIGLAKTVDAMKFSATVQPIALPKHDPVMKGTATLAGFGTVAV